MTTVFPTSVPATSAFVCPTFTLNGPPRTKKNHGVTKILPSLPYLEWYKLAMQQVPIIRTIFRMANIRLPISGPVAVKALFYREARVGDLNGYMQALGDFLQESRMFGNKQRTGAGIIKEDSQICSWDGSRRLHDKNFPRIEVTISILPEGME